MFKKKKPYEVKINTNFHNDKMATEGSHCLYLLVVLIDSVFQMGINNYLHVVLEEYTYIVKEKEVTNMLMKT